MKVSVIVPVYNCEKFIEEFVECLQGQTMSDFEAFFVDDCSDDRTSILLKDAVGKDSRFRYFRNEIRQGAANSRNRGIELSSAPYILCLDADDRFEADLLKQVTKAAYDNDADMVMLERGDFYGVDVRSICRRRQVFEDEKLLYAQKVFSVAEQPIDFLLRCENGTCDRMIRRELLDKYQIRFQNLKNSNDVFYTLFSTFCAERIVHTATFDNLYHRRVHAEPGRISNSRDPMCAYEALQKVHDKLVEYDKWEQYCVHFWVFALDSLEKQLFVCKDVRRQREVYEYIQSEGLQRLGVNIDAHYRRLPEAFQMQYKKFAELPYKEKCFEKAMMMLALCQLYSAKLLQLSNKLRDDKVAVWGAGKVAQAFVGEYKARGGRIDVIIDNDPKKQGSIVAGCPIVSCEEIYSGVDVIIISNRHYYNAISEQIREKRSDIEILSLEEIIFA